VGKKITSFPIVKKNSRLAPLGKKLGKEFTRGRVGGEGKVVILKNQKTNKKKKIVSSFLQMKERTDGSGYHLHHHEWGGKGKKGNSPLLK